jgi:hypothetical protein
VNTLIHLLNQFLNSVLLDIVPNAEVSDTRPNGVQPDGQQPMPQRTTARNQKNIFQMFPLKISTSVH